MNNDYVIIPGNLLRSNDLSMMQKLLYAKILGLDNDKGCYASNQYFADCLGVTKDYISKAITDLKKKGYVRVDLNYKPGSKEIESRTIRCMSDTYRMSVLEGIGQESKVNIKKEYKEEKESFDLFWINYPRKTGKAKAWNFWKNNFSKLPVSVINKHCKEAYAGTEKQYIPHPHTYLNQERYYDEIIKTVIKKDLVSFKDFKLDSTGNARIGYCSSCGSSDFYDPFKVASEDSKCCNRELKPNKGVINGKESRSSINHSKESRGDVRTITELVQERTY